MVTRQLAQSDRLLNASDMIEMEWENVPAAYLMPNRRRLQQIPTTLLAQCDSSIGGKTGVDFEGYKNMGILGVFTIGNPLLNEKLEHGYSPFFPIGLFFIIAKAISEVKANFFRGEALQYTKIMV